MIGKLTNSDDKERIMSSIQQAHLVVRPKILHGTAIAKAFVGKLAELLKEDQSNADNEIKLLMPIGSESDCKPLIDMVKYALGTSSDYSDLRDIDFGVIEVTSYSQGRGSWAILVRFNR